MTAIVKGSTPVILLQADASEAEHAPVPATPGAILVSRDTSATALARVIREVAMGPGTPFAPAAT